MRSRFFWAELIPETAQVSEQALSEYRRDKLSRLKNERAYREGLSAELLLNRAVRTVSPETALPLDIIAGEFGKPELRDGSIHFSLSHSGGRVLCALSDSPVGADIQRQTEARLSLARRFFTESEYRSLLNAVDKDYAFTRLWCLKESYIKMLGTGLNTPLSSFELSEGEGGLFRVAGDGRCLLRHWVRDGYHMALCALSDEEPAEMEELSLII